jgi:hypothetical protein
MINFKDRAGAVSPELTPATVVELRFAVDATEAPLAYPQLTYPDPDVVDHLEVELAGPGLLATLVVPVADARSWAGELFSAISVAYREATGDPHALSDFELASLGDPASIAAGEFTLTGLAATHWARCAELIERYADLGLGLVDASVIAVAERLRITVVASIDRRDLLVVRPTHCAAFELIPRGRRPPSFSFRCLPVAALGHW